MLACLKDVVPLVKTIAVLACHNSFSAACWAPFLEALSISTRASEKPPAIWARQTEQILSRLPSVSLDRVDEIFSAISTNRSD